jgi:hypothetical protein
MIFSGAQLYEELVGVPKSYKLPWQITSSLLAPERINCAVPLLFPISATTDDADEIFSVGNSHFNNEPHLLPILCVFKCCDWDVQLAVSLVICSSYVATEVTLCFLSRPLSHYAPRGETSYP